MSAPAQKRESMSSSIPPAVPNTALHARIAELQEEVERLRLANSRYEKLLKVHEECSLRATPGATMEDRIGHIEEDLRNHVKLMRALYDAPPLTLIRRDPMDMAAEDMRSFKTLLVEAGLDLSSIEGLRASLNALTGRMAAVGAVLDKHKLRYGTTAELDSGLSGLVREAGEASNLRRQLLEKEALLKKLQEDLAMLEAACKKHGLSANASKLDADLGRLIEENKRLRDDLAKARAELNARYQELGELNRIKGVLLDNGLTRYEDAELRAGIADLKNSQQSQIAGLSAELGKIHGVLDSYGFDRNTAEALRASIDAALQKAQRWAVIHRLQAQPSGSLQQAQRGTVQTQPLSEVSSSSNLMQSTVVQPSSDDFRARLIAHAVEEQRSGHAGPRHR